MIIQEYPLIYVRQSDSKIFRAKKIIPGHYVLIDPLTGEKERIGRSKLRRLFEFQRDVSMDEVRKSTRPLITPRSIA
jgi:hypothetical protein